MSTCVCVLLMVNLSFLLVCFRTFAGVLEQCRREDASRVGQVLEVGVGAVHERPERPVAGRRGRRAAAAVDPVRQELVAPCAAQAYARRAGRRVARGRRRRGELGLAEGLVQVHGRAPPQPRHQLQRAAHELQTHPRVRAAAATAVAVAAAAHAAVPLFPGAPLGRIRVAMAGSALAIGLRTQDLSA